MTERSISDHLEAERKKQPDYVGLSLKLFVHTKIMLL